MARLVKYVFAGGRYYGPDDEVPESVAKTITSRSAWGGEAGSESGAASSSPAAPEKPKRRSPKKEKPAEGTVRDVPESSPAPRETNESDDPNAAPDGDGVGTAGTE